MTLADANDLAQIIGAVAIIASLIFVGLQMRQNTRAVRATMSQAHAAAYQDMMRGVYSSAELTKIWTTGMFSPEKLTETERMQFMMFMAAACRFWDACYIQYREGQLPEAHWRSMERMIVDMRGNPGVRAWWERRKETMSAEFRDWYDAQELRESSHLVEPFEVHSGKLDAAS